MEVRREKNGLVLRLGWGWGVEVSAVTDWLLLNFMIPLLEEPRLLRVEGVLGDWGLLPSIGDDLGRLGDELDISCTAVLDNPRFSTGTTGKLLCRYSTNSAIILLVIYTNKCNVI